MNAYRLAFHVLEVNAVCEFSCVSPGEKKEKEDVLHCGWARLVWALPTPDDSAAGRHHSNQMLSMLSEAFVVFGCFSSVQD